ncbi:zona pellucida protein AX 4 isoform X1 [Astyanax mexicanus]|uniref:zona pellucida protein AX 4 isoform X1 n=1 Tax=Astyanax mexicanus TaxID=7994 RepID=UPI0020CB1D7F|nr:zona pellucida protein AX 4 isoform X1 [Astyanax mexicanus]
MSLTSRIMLLSWLLTSLPLCCSISVPFGIFTAKCHERHFWLTIKASFLGSEVQFSFEDSTAIHFLSSQQAAECGYTVVLNYHGDLVFRASYLACHVDNKKDTEFRLQVWFVNRQIDGRVNAYPFKLLCSLAQPWSPREIVCEENYMEASVQWHFPVVLQGGVKRLNLLSEAPEDRAKRLSKSRVVFYRQGDAHQASQSIQEAAVLGYHIVSTDTRILLRSAYSSPLSYTLKEQDIQVEAVTAVITILFEGMSIPVEISMACAKSLASFTILEQESEPVVDGLYILSTFPLILSSLVQGWFGNGGMRMGIGERTLSECELHEGGYEATLKGQTVEIRIPSGAQGAQIKSGVIQGLYAQSLSVDLFFMHHWEDMIWLHTQHRSLQLLRTPYVPQTPTLINNTDSSTSMFSITLGVFAADVSLHSITVKDETMTWKEAGHQGLHLFQLPFSNGSHAYTLQVPFSHRLVTQKGISVQYKRYILAFTFDFIIFPAKQRYSYSADVVCDVKQPGVSAWLEGKCTEGGILVVLHYGSEDVQWELYVGQRMLDWELVRLGDYRLKSKNDYLSVEMPLYSPGMTYEEFSLKDVVAKVEFSAVNVATFKVEHSLVQRCKFPVRDLLVCLPERRMVVVTDTTRSVPPTSPNSTTLLDPSCVPVATDSTRALFNFSLDSCGTTVSVEGSYLLYENQIRYAQKFGPEDAPIIHTDSPFRLTLQCRYPVNDTRTVAVHLLPDTTIKSPSLPWT